MDKLERIGFYTMSENRAEHSSAASNLKRVEIILNDTCNFNCTYCRGLKPELQKTLSLETVKHYIDICADDKVENIRFSGGEPTLHPNIKDIIKYTKTKSINRIAVSTNGSASFELYKDLIQLGVNDFSISLDACCSETGTKMLGGIKNKWERVIENIEKLSKLTYVTVGVVLTQDNLPELKKTIELAHLKGVADIRIIPAAQFGNTLADLQIDDIIKEKHPILKYRLDNISKNTPIRGLGLNDNHRCPLVLDDIAIAGEYHFPCIIYIREKGKAIGNVCPKMRLQRKEWAEKHNTYLDPICRENCLDVCREYNNKHLQYHSKIKLEKLDSSLFNWESWENGGLFSLNIANRYNDILDHKNRHLIKEHAVGWCDGERTVCRPKTNQIAVMFLKEDRFFWTHLMKSEFHEIFAVKQAGESARRPGRPSYILGNAPATDF